jgi:hypothetical protein
MLAACGGDDGGYKAPSAAKKREAVRTAEALYLVARQFSTLKLARGPCIGNKLPNLGPDWVVDIAHDPRRPIDEEPRNQCPKSRDGRAQHFVELDPSGKVIRVR